MARIRNESPKLRIGTTLFLMLAIAACGLVSCKKTEQARRYSLKGKVVSVDTKNGYLEVDHEAIPGFMAAMTMPYPVPDARVLSSLAAGDEITATVVVTSHGARLEDIVVTRKGAAPEDPRKK